MRKLNRKGFTLAELLIVVAIIGVLVAVSLPIFTAQLEKSRESTDIANLRAAKAEAVSLYLVGDVSDTASCTWTDTNDPGKGFTAYYNAKTGKLQASSSGIDGYGAGSATVGSEANTDFNYVPATAVTKKVIQVVVDANGNCTFSWVAAN